MSDILIRGMEMPKDCVHCSLLEGSTDDGLCHAASKWLDDEYFRWYQFPEGDIDDSKPLNCPLVPLPEGHGRLIDADELRHIIGSFSLTWEYGQGVSDCFAALVSAPTIIEAEGEDE